MDEEALMAADEYVFIPGEHGEKITTLVSFPQGYDASEKPAVILAHGAGNDMFNPLLTHMAHVLDHAGFLCVRFNFPYRDRGRRNPDSDDVLMTTWLSVYQYFKNHPGYQPAKVVAAGKSLGGRIASQAVAAGLLDVNGLILLGYPLHPPGKKDVLRDAHLHRLKVPMLFFEGSHDPFCDVNILRDTLSRIQAPWTVEVIEGAEHSFKMPQSSGVTEEQVYARILGKTLSWLETI
jgi:predicted alpha/beta-hydrolase family hydrolase